MIHFKTFRGEDYFGLSRWAQSNCMTREKQRSKSVKSHEGRRRDSMFERDIAAFEDGRKGS